MFNLLRSSLHKIIVYIIGQGNVERRTSLDNCQAKENAPEKTT